MKDESSFLRSFVRSPDPNPVDVLFVQNHLGQNNGKSLSYTPHCDFSTAPLLALVASEA